MHKGILQILALGSLLCLLAACNRCSQDNNTGHGLPDRKFKSKDLLLDVSAFPKDWYQSDPGSELDYELVPNCGIEGFITIFLGPSGSASQSIYRFSSIEDAERAFSSWSIPNANRISPWEQPTWISYSSPLTSNFRILCAKFGETATETQSVALECHSFVQYDEYISDLSIGMKPPDTMINNSELFLNLLKAIDERMRIYLQK